LKPAGPESESFTVTETLTGTNLLFGGQRMFGLALQATAGDVVSMLIPLTVAEAALPARSVHVPTTDWIAPWIERIVEAGGLPAASPESASAQLNETVTLVLFQPFEFATGVAELLMVGGVLSSLIIDMFGASTLPALSVLKNEIVLIPSVLITKEAELPFIVVAGIA